MNNEGTVAKEGDITTLDRGKVVGVLCVERVLFDLAMLAAQVSDLAGLRSRVIASLLGTSLEGVQVREGRCAVVVLGRLLVDVVGY